MRVKICGITQPEQGRHIAELGADAIGVIGVRRSPRYVAPETIREIAAALPAGTVLVGVFADADLDTIAATARTGNLSAIQLHGSETPEFCQRLRDRLSDLELVKAIRVRAPESLAAALTYAAVADSLLLDAYHPQQLGGTGRTLDWTALRDWRSPLPWFLAGGLTPENVAEAIALRPDGLDLSSGVECALGVKDLARVAELMSVVRSESPSAAL